MTQPAPAAVSRPLAVLCWTLSGAAAALGLFMALGVLIACLAPFGEITVDLSDGRFTTFTYAADLGSGELVLSDSASSAETHVPASELGSAWRLLVLAWAGVPAAFLIWGLNGARRCFAGIARGRFFERPTVGGLRNFALGVLLYMVAQPLIRLALTPIVGAALGVETAPEMVLTVEGDALLILLFSGAVAVVAQALARAAAIAEENEQFV